ncbi:putative reverse transcriptase domain-containing protein [Tanacetum coccineum]|uniref:Reverse transcriptase domain-containing protein n=1 Tax=Tanacetum coccineum TaxID=301880 RepID=A0ABQ5ABD3_9ASTR
MSSLLKRSPSLNGGVGAINEEAAFSTVLSKSLMQAPILALPEGSEDFIAYCDASKKSLGAVLMQKNGVSHLKDLEDIRLYGTKCTVKSSMETPRVGPEFTVGALRSVQKEIPHLFLQDRTVRQVLALKCPAERLAFNRESL